MNAIYIWVANVGSNLGVVASGFITDNMGWRWVWWWCAILFGVQLIAFVFGFEETKFTHVETLEARQGSVVSVPGFTLKQTPVDDKDKEVLPGKEADMDVEAGSSESLARKLSVIHVDPSIPRKTYWQTLVLTTTSPGKWSDFLRHSWQPFMLLVRSLEYCFVLWSTQSSSLG